MLVSSRAQLRGQVTSLHAALRSLRHPRSSFTGKLMGLMLLTTTVALLVAGVALLVTDAYHDRRVWGEQLRSTARILALASAPALSFEDRKTAARNLASVAALPEVRSAALYDAGGRLYATFITPGAHAPPKHLEAAEDGLHFSGGDAWLKQPVMQADEQLGTIVLHARYDLSGPILTYAGVLGAVTLLGLLA